MSKMQSDKQKKQLQSETGEENIELFSWMLLVQEGKQRGKWNPEGRIERMPNNPGKSPRGIIFPQGPPNNITYRISLQNSSIFYCGWGAVICARLLPRFDGCAHG
jgi:hypothetical protein